MVVYRELRMGENSIIATLTDEVKLANEKRDYLEEVLSKRLEEATEKAHENFELWLKNEYNVTYEELETQMKEMPSLWLPDLYSLFRSIAWFSYDDSLPTDDSLIGKKIK